MGANRPMTVEDYSDDLRARGPLYRAYARARVAQFKAAGLTGETLSQAVSALEDARQTPGTGPFWRLLEEVRKHQVNGGRSDLL